MPGNSGATARALRSTGASPRTTLASNSSGSILHFRSNGVLEISETVGSLPGRAVLPSQVCRRCEEQPAPQPRSLHAAPHSPCCIFMQRHNMYGLRLGARPGNRYFSACIGMGICKILQANFLESPLAEVPLQHPALPRSYTADVLCIASRVHRSVYIRYLSGAG